MSKNEADPINFNQLNVLRFIFVYLIIYGHFIIHFVIPTYNNPEFTAVLHRWFTHGYNYCCEGLFFISGFFLYRSSAKYQNFSQYFKHRYFKLATPMFLLMLVYFFVSLFGLYNFHFIAAITQILFLPYTGLFTKASFPGLWYLDVLLYVSIFYFFLIKNVPSKYLFFLICIITYFSFIALLSKNYGFYFTLFYQNFFYSFMLRGARQSASVFFAGNFCHNFQII